MRLSELATNVAHSTQAAVREWTNEYGRERGLLLFARRVGITERRARSLAEGTAGRIDAAEYIAAQQARAEILRARIARAQQHLHEIEDAHGMGLEPPRRGAAEAVINGSERQRTLGSGRPMVPRTG